jgi:hypothetical protein
MMSDPDLARRDQRLNDVIHATGWPLVRQVQTCARAGSVTLMSQNIFHRRNRRRVRRLQRCRLSCWLSEAFIVFTPLVESLYPPAFFPTNGPVLSGCGAGWQRPNQGEPEIHVAIHVLPND